MSPVSYWDGRHYGHIVGPIEVALVIAACVWGWRKFTSWIMRGLFSSVNSVRGCADHYVRFDVLGGAIEIKNAARAEGRVFACL